MPEKDISFSLVLVPGGRHAGKEVSGARKALRINVSYHMVSLLALPAMGHTLGHVLPQLSTIIYVFS